MLDPSLEITCDLVSSTGLMKLQAMPGCSQWLVSRLHLYEDRLET